MFRVRCTSRNLSESDRQQMQATCIGCRDCKHYRGAQSITIASGTSCLQVAQKESRKRLVGDKALEKYALQFWGATARAAILATVAYATRNIHLTSHVTNSKGNCLFCGGAINRKSCRVIPPSDMPPRIGSLATRPLCFPEPSICRCLSTRTRQSPLVWIALTSFGLRATMHLSCIKQSDTPLNNTAIE